jgi:hypothetical protein
MEDKFWGKWNWRKTNEGNQEKSKWKENICGDKKGSKDLTIVKRLHRPNITTFRKPGGDQSPCRPKWQETTQNPEDTFVTKDTKHK